jgi:hypothetical protein
LSKVGGFMDKNYGLTKDYNEGVKDKAPDWMDDFFKNANKDTEKKENPFKGVDNFLNIGLK